jgi:two-component sensor histidine kinase
VEAWLPFSPTRLPEQRCFLVSSAPLSIDHRPKALVCAQEITGLKRVEADLRATVGKLESALTEKTVLLQEVHHRVKNNLAVISSLLNMKADMTSDGPAKVALEESQRRVHSIALIHEHLYGSEHLDRINFAEYAQQLVQVLHSAFNGASARIAIRMDIDPIELGVHLAVPAALILNELLSNALKYAFPAGRNGEIHVTFREWEPGHVELAVEDDGIGSPDLLVERKTRSVGLQIVRILTAQLGGTLEQELRPGTRVVLRFPAVNARRAGQ